jgi:hypothetical protein
VLAKFNLCDDRGQLMPGQTITINLKHVQAIFDNGTYMRLYVRSDRWQVKFTQSELTSLIEKYNEHIELFE